jgi:amidase
MNELVKLTARQVVSLLKRGEVSPLELIDVVAARIEETDWAINALPTLCLERAQEHARKLTSRTPPSSPGYLFGLPIAVKDLEEVAGVRTTKGSRIFAGYIPRRSDYTVETLEQNGAVVIAKSNTPEFGAGANTFNEVFGATRNPWDTRMTAGGSSGGSAAALATGQVWLATGSDFGGSVRIPGSYCSVVGLRTTPGRVARGPDVLPFSNFSVKGPMGRTVGDVALMLDAQVGEHVGDPLSLPPPMTPFTGAVDHPEKPRRVAYSHDLSIAVVDREVKEICARAASSFAELGVVVEEACPDMHDAEEIFQVLRAASFAASLGTLLERHRDQLKPELVWNIEKGLRLTGDEIARAERMRGAYYHRTIAFFQDYDLLLCPTVVAPPFDVNIRYLTEIDGVAFDSYISWLVLTFAITLTACPAISVPCGYTPKGLPVGLQIVGPPRGEAAVLGAAALFEDMHGISDRVPIDPRVATAGEAVSRMETKVSRS